jgi:hypothetical protein
MNFRGKLESQPHRPACEWSRGDASDIDGQAERPNERQRMSQSFRSLDATPLLHVNCFEKDNLSS